MAYLALYESLWFQMPFAGAFQVRSIGKGQLFGPSDEQIEKAASKAQSAIAREKIGLVPVE